MVKLEHIKTGRVFELPGKNALDLLVNFPDDYRVKKGIEKIEYLKKFLADVEKLVEKKEIKNAGKPVFIKYTMKDEVKYGKA